MASGVETTTSCSTCSHTTLSLNTTNVQRLRLLLSPDAVDVHIDGVSFRDSAVAAAAGPGSSGALAVDAVRSTDAASWSLIPASDSYQRLQRGPANYVRIAA